MKLTATTVQELRRILDALPAEAEVSFAGESGLAVLLQHNAAGRAVVSIDHIGFDVPESA
ncbi:MAG: hypothetical protein Q8J78_03325 [Moraxellaceae bacterium]|nr:hypothetical protein [Moraxellaceae bacterium]